MFLFFCVDFFDVFVFFHLLIFDLFTNVQYFAFGQVKGNARDGQSRHQSKCSSL